MVEAVGSLSKLLGRTVQPAAPVTAFAPAERPAVGNDEARITATQVARDLAGSAPIDHDRVAEIKQAIAAGKYPIAPETVADRLLALKLDWKPGHE